MPAKPGNNGEPIAAMGIANRNLGYGTGLDVDFDTTVRVNAFEGSFDFFH